MRRSLPEQIKSSGYVFVLNVHASHARKAPDGVRYRTVKCMHKNLEGVRDLHGRYYKPSIWIYTEKS